MNELTPLVMSLEQYHQVRFFKKSETSFASTTEVYRQYSDSPSRDKTKETFFYTDEKNIYIFDAQNLFEFMLEQMSLAGTMETARFVTSSQNDILQKSFA